MNLRDLDNPPRISEARRQADIARIRIATTNVTGFRSREHLLHHWGRRASVIAGAAVFLLGGGATATALIVQHLSSQEAGVTTHGRCYSQVSSNYGSDFPGTTAVNAADQSGWTPDLVSTLVADCAATWRAGALREQGPGPHPASSPSAPFPVPELVACVLPDGEAAVFPGDASTCGRLGLPELSAGTN